MLSSLGVFVLWKRLNRAGGDRGDRGDTGESNPASRSFPSIVSVSLGVLDPKILK